MATAVFTPRLGDLMSQEMLNAMRAQSPLSSRI